MHRSKVFINNCAHIALIWLVWSDQTPLKCLASTDTFRAQKHTLGPTCVSLLSVSLNSKHVWIPYSHAGHTLLVPRAAVSDATVRRSSYALSVQYSCLSSLPMQWLSWLKKKYFYFYLFLCFRFFVFTIKLNLQTIKFSPGLDEDRICFLSQMRFIGYSESQSHTRVLFNAA